MSRLSRARQEALKFMIQDGIPLTPQPYRDIAGVLGVDEAAVIETLQEWKQSGLIKRFGLVVNHHRLGYRANAMVVWDVPDDHIEAIAGHFTADDAVTLCYQRPRVLPDWPYNLFCMIHGRDRDAVLQQIESLVERHQLQQLPRDVLFSARQFKQCGGRFADTRLAASHG